MRKHKSRGHLLVVVLRHVTKITLVISRVVKGACFAIGLFFSAMLFSVLVFGSFIVFFVLFFFMLFFVVLLFTVLLLPVIFLVLVASIFHVHINVMTSFT